MLKDRSKLLVNCWLTRALILLVLAGAFSGTALLAGDYVEGEALITFKDSVSLDAAKAALNAHQLQLAKHFASISRLAGRHIGLVRSKHLTTAQLLVALEHDPAVQVAEPSFFRHPYGTSPNDAFFPQLWGLRNTGQTVNGAAGTPGADISFLQAWSLARPSTNQVVVAVIDSGVNYTHPDLAANMWTNPGEIANNGIDDDHNGYIDDYYGYDFADADPDPAPVSEHGTHVAGTIAAGGNNFIGVVGVDYQAKIMALKVESDSYPGSFPDSAIIEALDYCVMMKTNGVNIVAINASWGGGSYSSAMLSAIDAAGGVGIIFCAAAGNSSSDNDYSPQYPANYRLPNMIVVAASGVNDTLAGFSNYGASTVDLAAPGVSILSTVPPGDTPTFALVEDTTNTFSANPLEYSSTNAGITAQVYDCGLGNPADFPPEVSGNIALISRGTLYFSDKVSNAMAAGALAAIIYNNASGNFSGTLGSSAYWIPAVSISQADGALLKAALPTSATVAPLSFWTCSRTLNLLEPASATFGAV